MLLAKHPLGHFQNQKTQHKKRTNLPRSFSMHCFQPGEKCLGSNSFVLLLFIHLLTEYQNTKECSTKVP